MDYLLICSAKSLWRHTQIHSINVRKISISLCSLSGPISWSFPKQITFGEDFNIAIVMWKVLSWCITMYDMFYYYYESSDRDTSIDVPVSIKNEVIFSRVFRPPSINSKVLAREDRRAFAAVQEDSDPPYKACNSLCDHHRSLNCGVNMGWDCWEWTTLL